MVTLQAVEDETGLRSLGNPALFGHDPLERCLEEVPVGAAESLSFAGFHQPISGILPGRFQVAVAGFTLLLFCHHERAPDQVFQQREDLASVEALAGAGGLRGLEGPSRYEDAQTA